MDHAVERGAQHLLRHFGTPTGAAGEVGEGGSDEDPNPGFGGALLGRRFIDVQHGLRKELLGQFVVGRLGGVGGVVVQHPQPAGAGGLVEDQAQEVRGPAFGLDGSRP